MPGAPAGRDLALGCRTGACSSSWYLRATSGARHDSAPAFKVATRPSCVRAVTRKRGSRAAKSRASASESSIEPSSTSTHSQPDSRWRSRLRRQLARVSRRSTPAAGSRRAGSCLEAPNPIASNVANAPRDPEAPDQSASFCAGIADERVRQCSAHPRPEFRRGKWAEDRHVRLSRLVPRHRARPRDARALRLDPARPSHSAAWLRGWSPGSPQPPPKTRSRRHSSSISRVMSNGPKRPSRTRRQRFGSACSPMRRSSGCSRRRYRDGASAVDRSASR